VLIWEAGSTPRAQFDAASVPVLRTAAHPFILKVFQPEMQKETALIFEAPVEIPGCFCVAAGALVLPRSAPVDLIPCCLRMPGRWRGAHGRTRSDEPAPTP
jgi:hypothetical protein